MADIDRGAAAGSACPPAPPALLDEQLLDQLEQDLSAELMPRMLAAFLSESAQRAAAIQWAVERGDPRAAGAEAHALKGAAASFGALSLRDIADAIEAAGSGGRLADVGRQLPALRQQTDATSRALHARFTDVPSG